MKLVKYSAKWCGPCKQFAPIAHRVTQELGMELVEVDIDETPTPGIQSVPTIQLVDDEGKVVAQKSGALAPVALKKWIAENQ